MRLFHSILILSAVVLAGCGSLEGVRPARTAALAAEPLAECNALSRDQALFTAGGIAFGFVGGGAGIASIPVKSEGLKNGLEIGAVAATAVSLGAGSIAASDAVSWAKSCSGP